MTTWTLEKAKNQLSEVVRRALSHEPQLVTRGRHDAVVVLAREDYERLVAPSGIVDFLRDGETGLFCEVKNPKSIAEQVQRLIVDEPLRKKIVENAGKMVEEKYDWDLIAKEMKTQIFDKV